MGMEGDLTLVGEHTLRHTDDVLRNCTLESYIVVLTGVAPINLLLKNNGIKNVFSL